MRLLLLGFALALIACAHTSTRATPEVEERTACDVDPSLKRIAKPAGDPRCSTKESRDAYTAACLAEDPSACYFIGICVLADSAGQSEAVKRERVHQAAPFLDIACKAGMAEACTLRAGTLAEVGVAAKDTCDDLTQGARLGNASAQLACIGACLRP